MIKTTVKDGKVMIKCPFDETFRKRAKQLGGKWEWETYSWIFDERHEAQARKLCFAIYGTDGTPVPMVTLHMRLRSDSHYIDDKEIRIGGRAVVTKKGRDVTPVTANGVALIEGEFASFGGSARYPRITIIGKAALLEVLDVPLSIAQALVELDEDTFTIANEESTHSNALTASERSIVDAFAALDEERRHIVHKAILDEVLSAMTGNEQ